jgi:membrane associated rhomboid family serine protease
MRGSSFQSVVPVTYIVKRLMIINAVLWVGLVLIVQNFFMSQPYFFDWFGFTPIKFFEQFWLWQPLTYMFFHSPNVFHVLFNMLLLWWLGAELEVYWGRRFFLFYYLACGVGAAFVYLSIVLVYFFITGNVNPLMAPVVGASGAIFGLILAYGLIFGERVVYFLMLFPMKAKFFVMIIGGVELMNLLSQGFSSDTANLAHLGGIVTGYILLRVGPKIQEFWLRRQTRAHGRRLKLVVDNDPNKPHGGGGGKPSSGGPKYWN